MTREAWGSASINGYGVLTTFVGIVVDYHKEAREVVERLLGKHSGAESGTFTATRWNGQNSLFEASW